MEYIYPAFEQGRIMKKELLWALRDYTYGGMKLTYQQYSEGIINGCGLTTDGQKIHIGQGILKCRDFIFLIQKEETVAYRTTEEYISLKFRIIRCEELPDYVRYKTEFILDQNLEKGEDELELSRFKLKSGAHLRCEYKDFLDIETEFDTLNLCHATWAGPGGITLSKEVTDYYAKEVLCCGEAGQEDIQFAYLCLDRKEAVPRQIIMHYIRVKSGKSIDTVNLWFAELGRILRSIKSGKNYPEERRDFGKKVIFVD